MLKHLFPRALDNANLTKDDITLPAESCGVIQNLVEEEGGVRKVNACIRVIVDKMALLLKITEAEKQALNLSFDVNTSNKPIVLTSEIIRKLYPTNKESQSWEHLYL